MAGKVLNILLVGAFLLNTGCTTRAYVSPNEEDSIKRADKVIVKTKSQDEHELNDVHLVEQAIVGYTKTETKKEIDLLSIESVMTVDYNIGWIIAYSVLYGMVVFIGAELAYCAATAPPPPPSSSCPFVFSFDGEKYRFDAEPYGGAICKRLKRTEWCLLEHLEDVDGEYRILTVNKLQETQYTDEMKLLVVDHPRGIQIVPDISGGIHTIANLVPPVAAHNKRGRNILPFVSRRDSLVWQTRIEGRDPGRGEDMRHELVFEFPKPRTARKVKLLVNGCTSFWGSRIAKTYLELHGDKIREWYDEINNYGAALYKSILLNTREELYYLQIRVLTENGWQSKGTLVGGGPFAPKDKVYVLDLSDVSGDALKIKLTPPASFWMIDRLAVDYSDNVPIDVREIDALSAVDHHGRDVREILARNDNRYHVMPKIGDKVLSVFQAPGMKPGKERSVLLKASGYYDIHLRSQGTPQTDLLDRIHSEPGFAVQYAFDKYLTTTRLP